MAEKKLVKSKKSKKEEMVEVVIHDKSEPFETPNAVIEGSAGMQIASGDAFMIGDEGPFINKTPNLGTIPRERLARLVAETNNFRIVEKFDDESGKVFYEVTNRRTDESKKFETLSDASMFINNAGLR